ncbi:hypothetical protein ASE01_04780 [Nocardioides sp. Root190]|uniref:hypothetical protein n=1 Tax=Nocardioides sp. Root190 TaxID=1736488 RepID=UPI0006F1C57D|nr:hypothetical protein [Nocardioides sp. Root190]KRB78576.1 hypothetical protein ASE01_04780 [Nocardioides sp. Root190]
MRSSSALLLVIVATILAPFAIGTTWLTGRVDDRQEYLDAIAPLADDAGVRQVMADAAAAASVTALERYSPVGLPSAVSDWAQLAATQVVESPEFPTFWRQANEDVHRDALALLEDPDAPTDGSLTVDASPLVAQILLELEDRGIPVGLLPRIPLQVPVVERAKIVEAGPTYRSAHEVAQWLPVVWAGLVALALLIAVGWRGRVRTAGLAMLGVALAGGVLLLAADPLAEAAADRAEVANQELVRIMLDAVLGSLAPYSRGFLLALPVGLVLLAGSFWPRREYVHDEDHGAYAE